MIGVFGSFVETEATHNKTTHLVVPHLCACYERFAHLPMIGGTISNLIALLLRSKIGHTNAIQQHSQQNR